MYCDISLFTAFVFGFSKYSSGGWGVEVISHLRYNEVVLLCYTWVLYGLIVFLWKLLGIELNLTN